jgi:hypothetical protein
MELLRELWEAFRGAMVTIGDVVLFLGRLLAYTPA